MNHLFYNNNTSYLQYHYHNLFQLNNQQVNVVLHYRQLHRIYHLAYHIHINTIYCNQDQDLPNFLVNYKHVQQNLSYQQDIHQYKLFQQLLKAMKDNLAQQDMIIPLFIHSINRIIYHKYQQDYPKHHQDYNNEFSDQSYQQDKNVLLLYYPLLIHRKHHHHQFQKDMNRLIKKFINKTYHND